MAPKPGLGSAKGHLIIAVRLAVLDVPR